MYIAFTNGEELYDPNSANRYLWVIDVQNHTMHSYRKGGLSPASEHHSVKEELIFANGGRDGVRTPHTCWTMADLATLFVRLSPKSRAQQLAENIWRVGVSDVDELRAQIEKVYGTD